jgi:hypothetical protein
MICPLCEKRKAKRFCPAKGTQICSRCCGAEREVTIACPFECTYLQEARQHDYKGGIAPKDFPHKEVQIDEGFLRDHGELTEMCARELFRGAAAVPGATDADARQALEALIQTSKTLDSGIYYDTRPDSSFARRIADHVQEAVRQFRETETRQAGFPRTREGDILRVWVFLYRMALDRDNGRPKGKAFLDFLRLHFQPQPSAPQPSLIIPGV